jgi:signal transduction histidine kinase
MVGEPLDREVRRRNETYAQTNLHSPRATIVLVCLVAILSYVAPRLQSALMRNLQTVWPLWPGCAILVAVLMMVRTRIWPVLILVSFAGFIVFDLRVGVPVASIVWFIPADTIEVLTAAIGLRYWFGGVPRLNNANSLAKYGLVAVVLAPFVAAFVSARGIPGDYWTSWRTSFLSEVLAFLTLTPAILSWLNEGPAWLQKARTYHIEFAVLTATTVLLSYFAFAAGTKSDSPALLYSLVPLLLWSALRFGWIGITSSLITIFFLSVWGLVHGRGPFLSLGSQSSMLSLQLFLIFAATPFMILTAVVEDRKRAGEQLETLSGRLIEAQEEERKRIARDVHDDYSQRLAMLAIDVENLTEKVGDSSVETKQELLDFYQRISELGADMHSLSHQLHSSTLESLGLVAGVKVFCEEFAYTEHVQVDFVHENVPRSIPGDVALCLFRIVQEGLRNVKRHSGADKANIRIDWSGENLHLTVSDRGKGFASGTPPAGGGIGIWSMQERVRLIGGRFEIQSHPMQGTRIDAWLPFKSEWR